MDDEKDICGCDDFMGFDFVTVKLPTDVIEKIERLYSAQERLSIDGMYALLLREGIRNLDESVLDMEQFKPQYGLPKHVIEQRRKARELKHTQEQEAASEEAACDNE